MTTSKLPVLKQYLATKPDYYQTLASLKTLYENLRNYEKNAGKQFLKVKDFIEFLELSRSANIKILNEYKTMQTGLGVNLLSAHGSKGLEFDYVILLDVNEDLWKGKGRPKLIKEPSNLNFYSERDEDDDYLRLLFVACTRAKKNLLVTYPLQKLNQKEYKKLSFLLDCEAYHITSESLEGNNEIGDVSKDQAANVIKPSSFHPAIEQQLKFKPKLKVSKNQLLKASLENYKLSVTHLNNFLMIYGDTEETRCGPAVFRDINLLNFPSYKSENAKYGTAVHEALAFFIQNKLQGISDKEKQIEELKKIFKVRLTNQFLVEEEFKKYLEKGYNSLTRYWLRSDYNFELFDYKFEFSFSGQDVLVGEARLSGNIDLIKTNKITGEIEIIDFKTGQSIEDFTFNKESYKSIKNLRYLNQLQFYKILLKRSKTFSDKINLVKTATLEFVEAKDNELQKLSYDLSSFDEVGLELLIQKVWVKIMNLDFPDTNLLYANKVSSISAFIEDLKNEVV